MTPADDELLTALRSARPEPGYRPSPRSPEATAMLAGILGARREPEHSRRVTRRRIVLTGLPALAVAVVAAVVAVSVTSSGPAPGHLSATTVRTAVLDALRLRSNDILYQEELQPGQTVASYLKGYSDKPSDYDFTIQNKNTGVGVEQSSDSPISRFYLWSIRTTVSPEAYIHLNVPPGETRKWKIHYRFFSPPEGQ